MFLASLWEDARVRASEESIQLFPGQKDETSGLGEIEAEEHHQAAVSSSRAADARILMIGCIRPTSAGGVRLSRVESAYRGRVYGYPH